MKKTLHSLFIFFLIINSSLVLSQSASTIWFKGKGGGARCKCKISIGNQEDIEFSYKDVVRFRLFSTGNVKITLTPIPPCYIHGYEEVYINVEQGKNYFVEINLANTKQAMNLNKDISETIEWYDQVTQSLEENSASPINISYYQNAQKPDEDLPSSGTGFLVSCNGYILTNYHVIDRAINVKIKRVGENPEKEYRAKIIASDEDNDLAILKLDLDDPSEIKFDSLPYTFRFKGFDTGDDVFVLGYPLISSMGEEIKLTKGIISSKSGYQGNLNSCQISAAVQPGNSGSPVFDGNGNVIGIINSKIMNAEGVSYAIKPSFIESLFKNAEIDFIPPFRSKTQNLTLSQQTKLISPFVFIVIAER